MPNAIRKNGICKAARNRLFGAKLSRSPRDRRRAFWSGLESLKRQFEREHGLNSDSVMTDTLERAFILRVRALWQEWLPDHPFPAEWTVE